MYNFKKRIIYVIALSQQDDCDLIRLNFEGRFNQIKQINGKIYFLSQIFFFNVQKKKIWSITLKFAKITDYRLHFYST